MTKLKLSLRNSARRVLLLKLIIALFILSGCSVSTSPSFHREDIPKAIQDICKKEYKLNVKARLVGNTLWVYLPVENIFEKADKPQKFSEKFLIKENFANFVDNSLILSYSIKPTLPKEQAQDFKYNKEVMDKVNGAWNVIRRVLFSMDRKKAKEPRFILLVVADTKAGVLIKELSYYQDIQKLSYNLISVEEYQHRSIQDIDFAPEFMGDKEGRGLKYTNINLRDFVARQIQYRVRLKFQKPEVETDADIDKEILKVAALVIKVYGLKDFDNMEVINLKTHKRVLLNAAAIWAKPTD